MTGRLAALDVDSTLITSEVIELLAERAGVLPEVAALTEAAMQGSADFGTTLEARVALLAGLPATAIDEVAAEVRFTPGAQNLVETLHGEGWICVLLSGGFVEIVGPLAASLGIERFRANKLEIVKGVLTGRTVGPVIDRAAKATALREFAAAAEIPMQNTIAVGDGANDLDMMAAAGLGVAFNAKPVVQQQADVAVNSTRLDAVLRVLERQ